MTLPPLPEFAREFWPRWPDDIGGYTDAQMRAYAEQAVAAERARIAAHFDERDRGHDGKPLGAGFYEPHEPAEIIRSLGPNDELTGRLLGGGN